jgi:hypothetical protein
MGSRKRLCPPPLKIPPTGVIIYYWSTFMKKHITLLLCSMMATSLVAQAAAVQTITPNIKNDWPNSRYKVHGNTSTVTDTVTGLMWQQCSQGQAGTGCTAGSATAHTWQAALQLATTANTNKIAGYNDWRLPNIKELTSLAALDRYNPAINLTAFPNTASADFWSSSPYAFLSNHAWLVNFYNGSGYDDDRDSDDHVRLVRSGQ